MACLFSMMTSSSRSSSSGYCLDARERGQLLHDDLVRFERRGEIDQGLAQLKQHHDLAVLHGVTQLEFELVAFAVDDAQVPQVCAGVAVEDLEDEARTHERVEPSDRSLHERVQHRRVLHAYGDDEVFGDDDRQRDGLVPVTAPALLDGRDVHDDHRVIVLDVDARTFLVIQRGAQVGEVDAGLLGDRGELHVGGFGQTQPGAVLRFFDLLHLAVNRAEHPQHVVSPTSHNRTLPNMTGHSRT